MRRSHPNFVRPAALVPILLALMLLVGTASCLAAPKRILVFGDSNSFGWIAGEGGSVDRMPPAKVWPGQMAAVLGKDYEVIVEALGGRTTNIDCPVRSGSGLIPGAGMNGAAYLPAALSSHMPLDLVIIMLGSNDLKVEFNRDAFAIALGIGELVSIVTKADWQMRTAFAPPRVLVISPPKVNIQSGRQKERFAGSLAKTEHLPGILRPLVESAGATMFDAASVVPFAEAEDGLHFTENNHAVFGKAVAAEVKAIFSR